MSGESKKDKVAPMTQRLTPITIMMLVIPPALWAGNAVVGRMVNGLVPPLTLNFLRWALAFLILLPLAHRTLRADLDSERRRNARRARHPARTARPPVRRLSGGALASRIARGSSLVVGGCWSSARARALVVAGVVTVESTDKP